MADCRNPVALSRRVLVGLLLLCAAASAPAALSLPPGGEVELAGHLEVLESDAVGLDIDQVAGAQAGPFRALPGHFAAGLGKPREAWLRFTLRRGDGAPGDWRLRVLPPLLDQVDLYLPEGDGWRSLSVGDARPFGERAIDDRAAVFPLELGPGEERTYYVHMTQDGLFNAYFVLYTPEALFDTQSMEGMLFGLYFGGLVSLLLINLLHAVTLREALFAEFGLYLLLRTVYFFAFDGLLFRYLVPDSPVLAQQILQFSVSLVVASMAPLLVRLLDMGNLYPRLARLCHALGWAAVLIAMTVWFGWFTRVATLLSLIVMLLSAANLLTVFTRLRRGRPLDWLMLAVMLMLIAGHVLISLTGLGIHVSLVADLYGNQIGSIAVAIAMHFAVATRVMEIKRDRAASEEAAREARQNAERERRARREQADFVAMLLHEIKTPLAEISSATSVLEHLDDGSRRETGDRYDTIHDAVERLDRLVEQSLSRDRQGLDQDYMDLRSLNLEPLARELVERFDGSGGRRVTLSVVGGLPPVQADRELLGVALANLIDNACKYSTPGGAIEVELAADGRMQTLAVCDAGPPLDEQAAERVFDRFWRGSARDVGGAGLGLYLVRKIAEGHGGGVALECRAARGNRFVVSLPVAQP